MKEWFDVLVGFAIGMAGGLVTGFLIGVKVVRQFPPAPRSWDKH